MLSNQQRQEREQEQELCIVICRLCSPRAHLFDLGNAGVLGSPASVNVVSVTVSLSVSYWNSLSLTHSLFSQSLSFPLTADRLCARTQRVWVTEGKRESENQSLRELGCAVAVAQAAAAAGSTCSLPQSTTVHCTTFPFVKFQQVRYPLCKHGSQQIQASTAVLVKYTLWLRQWLIHIGISQRSYVTDQQQQWLLSVVASTGYRSVSGCGCPNRLAWTICTEPHFLLPVWRKWVKSPYWQSFARPLPLLLLRASVLLKSTPHKVAIVSCHVITKTSSSSFRVIQSDKAKL